ncbi:nucleoporin subcomplex protein binding to Pom34-domain-containing protein [Lipomyces kononenkoae]
MIALSTPVREIASSPSIKSHDVNDLQIVELAEDYDGGELISDAEQSLSFFLLQSKFPLVFVPFIEELKKLGPAAYEILLNTKTFMQNLPRGFRDYDVSPDDPQDIYLLSDLCVYAPREEDGEGGFYVPKGHHGRIIPNESNTFCVQWRYEYDGWSFLGRVLEHAAAISPTDVIVEEIISLISTTLQCIDNYTAMDMLESLCTKLRLEDDVINIIGNVLTNAMQRKNVNVSVAAIDFFTALIPVLPHKVWEFLSNSNLLDRNGGGMATFILSSVEIISGDYRFTLGVIQLVNVLVKDAVIGKFSTLIEPELRTNVLLQFARHLTYIYESFAYWKYENLSHRLDIAISISDLFSSLLLAVYGIDEVTDGTNKVNGVLVPAAQHLLDRFLVSDGKNLRCIQPIIGSIEASGRSLEALTADPELLNRNYEWIEAALIFAEKLTCVRTLLKRAPSQLERKLFGLAPAFTQLFVRESVLRFRIMKLLISIVDSVWEGTEPPSLLAHLGPGSAVTFVNALNKALEGKLDLNTQNEIARFASVVFSTKQQGLSVLLLSGRELGKDNSSTENKEKGSETSLLQALEKKAEQFEDLPVELSVNVLECIALAQNSRATAVFESKKNLDFLKKIFEILDRGTGGRISGLESTDTIIRFCYNALLAARAVQLCAVELHKSVRESSESKSIVDYFVKSDNLAKLADTAFRIQGYRASLHGNLHRNFDKKWPMARLIRFQKTSISQKQYGPSYKYDLEMMDDIFSVDPIWTGYRSEIVQANLNLSLIDAQSHLFQAWWLLIAALLEHAENNSKLLKALEQIAIQCLQINLDEGIMAPLFVPIVNDRSQLAFVIIQALHGISSASVAKQQFDFTKILSLAWEFISSVDVDFPQALTDGNIGTYRPHLRILLVCVGALKSTKADANMSQIISGILENIVSKTFMILGPDALEAFEVSKSQEGMQELNESANDMLLVTSLLRDCLAIDGVL